MGTKWEYRIEDFKYYDVEAFNKLGELGWEMCGYAYDPFGHSTQVFKRPKRSK